MQGRRVWRALLAGVALAVVLPAIGPAAKATSECSWPMYGHDPGHSFASAPGCSQLSVNNAASLLPAWVFVTPEPVTASTTVVDETVYVGDWGGTFYALPAHPKTGLPAAKWTFKVDDTNGVAFGRIVSTAAVATVGGRRVVIFGGGATLYVLDAATGHELAKSCLDVRDIAARCHTGGGQVEIESSPAVIRRADGTFQVIVGLDVHNGENVGRPGLVSLDLAGVGTSVTLTPRWKFDPEARATYTGPGQLIVGAGTGSGCGDVWGSPAVDVARGLVFFGTGSCSVSGVTSGEHAWALNAADGALQWSFGPPRTSTRLDDDFGASPNVLPGGLVGFAGKDGWYYALRERPSGSEPELVWANHVAESGHVNTDFAIGGIIGTPATGLVNGQPAIFAASAISTPIDTPIDFPNPSLDTTLLTDPGRVLSLAAIRASDGALLWRNVIARQSYGAVSYANGVVLVPSTFTFSLEAVNANNGLPLGILPVHGAPSSTPVALGDSVYLGVGTSETDLEFKAFGDAGVEPYLGSTALSRLSGVYGFKLLLPTL